jgi:predicted RND superfamily exporter protein
MWNKIANLILRNRFLILALHALLTVLFGYYTLTGLRIDNKYGNMLPKDTEAQITYLHFKEMFGEDGSSLVIAIQDDSLYTKQTFLKWKELGDSILQIPGVIAVTSEAHLFNIRNNKEKSMFEFRPIFYDKTFKDKSIDSIKKEIRLYPLYKDILYNPKTNVSLMMVKIEESYLLDRTKQKVVVDIENLAQSYEKEFGKVHFAGLPHMRVLIGRRVLSEMYVFIGLSVLVSSLLMYFFFRSVRVTMICNLVVMITVVWSLGTIGMLGYSLSIIMALIPTLMIVIGIPNCIYLYNKYHQEYQKHRNKAKALTRLIKKTGTAMFLTNVTTALGFITFLFTNSQKFYEFGVISSINIMLCFIVSLCLIPIFASFSKNPSERHLKHLDRKAAIGLLEKLVQLTAFKRTWIYWISSIIIIVSTIGVYKIKVTGNITGDLPKNDPILKDIQFIEKNFHGAVPFEVMIGYKEQGRLFSKSKGTLEKVEKVQQMFAKDSLFARSISIVDFLKVINMAYYGNNPQQYKIVSRGDFPRLKKYLDNINMSGNSAFSLKELVDTSEYVLRVRTQMRDIGSYEVADKVKLIRYKIDHIMNPDKPEIERLYAKATSGKPAYYDSLLYTYSSIYNGVTAELSNGDAEKQLAFDSDPELIKQYIHKPHFDSLVRHAINNEYFDIKLTGTSVVASEGTQYLLSSLFSSIFFAIISIALLMCILFYSFRMVVVSMIPNIIPLVMTAGIMGWFGIPLKPSTLLIFSIALGITVDNTIHFLARYRQELKLKKWDLKECVAISIRESGLSIIYTSVILFFGFIVFVFSSFGGTQALGYLSAITYLIALFTNMIILPALLLSLERRLTTKSFEEPFFELYDEEEDIDLDLLSVRDELWDSGSPEHPSQKEQEIDAEEDQKDAERGWKDGEEPEAPAADEETPKKDA